MRLSPDERNAIVASVTKFDDTAEIYLFGSRVDDSKRGGDIDVLIKSDLLHRESIGLIEEELFKRIEEQKVDLVLTPKSNPTAFSEMVLSKGAIGLCPVKN